MTRVATPRLIGAAATLDASDRALVNMWMHRGLDDAAVARLAGVTEETIAHRRARIIEQLSGELGLPAEDVGAALSEITAPPGPNGLPPSAPSAPAHERTAPPDESAAAARAAGVEAAGVNRVAVAGQGRPLEGAAAIRRRRLGPGAVALLVVAAAIALVVVVTSGSSTPVRRHVPASRPLQSVTRSATSASSRVAAPTAGKSPGNALVPLAGGPAGVTGSVRVSRGRPHPILSVTVRGLPQAAHGHYEVWLYNSLVYSEPVGRIDAPADSVSFRLRANANRYHSIDISFQPVGAVFDSGESVLRAANPLFGTGHG
jgi:hypothetical protein